MNPNLDAMLTLEQMAWPLPSAIYLVAPYMAQYPDVEQPCSASSTAPQPPSPTTPSPPDSDGIGPDRRTRESSCPTAAASLWSARVTSPTGPPSRGGCGGLPRRRGLAPCCC